MVGRKLSRWEAARVGVIKSLREREDKAKEERLGMWEFGDLTEY